MSEPASQSNIEPKLSVEKKHLAIVQKILQNRLPGAQVWAFGSRTTSTPKPYSDLDLAVINNKPTNLELLATLAEDFSNSDLPFKVDLVDWATTSEAFRSIIQKHKIVLQTP